MGQRSEPTGDSGGCLRVLWTEPRGLTLALSGEAAVASAKPAGNTIDEHHAEQGSGLVRFNALLGTLSGRRNEGETEPQTNGSFDSGEALGGEAPKPSNELGSGNRDEALRVKHTLTEKAEVDLNLESCVSGLGRMWDEGEQRALLPG
jgi:hypothetical protein